MTRQNETKLNRLERELPEGLLVSASWLTRHGFSRQLQNHYVAAKWLEQPARGVFTRPRGALTWQQVVVSLQTLLEQPLVVGGRTALELQGFTHYLSHAVTEVHLYGPKPPPTWLRKLQLGARFAYHNDRTLFHDETVPAALGTVAREGPREGPDALPDGFVVQTWGQWDWPMVLSSPERAALELLDELPARESFPQVDKLMEGLTSLSPRRLQRLLADCRSVKVKRLFFFFADRHQHSWLKRLDKGAIDLGKGKRMLVKGGRLNPTYQITVPEDLIGVQ